MRAINRINTLGLQYYIVEQPDNTTVIRVGKKSITVNYPIAAIDQAWYNWRMKGLKIQEAFYFMSADEREFLQTGITPNEWQAIFKEPQ